MQQAGTPEVKNATVSPSAVTYDSPKHPVLYIDDEPALLNVCKHYFDRRGSIAITCAGSAAEAIGILKTRSFAVIICDYQMPGMNGIDLLVHLRLQKDHTPFILFTGYGREETVIEAINNGATYYLQKHGSPTVLFAELEHKILEAVQRQTAETALKESEARYRAVFDNSVTAMVIHDEDLTISRCNDTFLRMTRWTRVDVEKRKILTEFITQDTIPQDCAHHKVQGLQPGGGVRQYEAEILTRTGEVLSVQVSACIIPGSTESIVSLIDITGQKRLREELTRREDEIRLMYTYLSADNKPFRNHLLPVPEKGVAEIPEAGVLPEPTVHSAWNLPPVRMWDKPPSQRNRRNSLYETRKPGFF